MPYSSTRTAPPWIVTIHTGEGILNRADMARFLDNNSGASAHAASDAGGVEAPLVPDERAAWTAGYTANNAGLHIEACAFAMLTRDQWLSESDVTIYVPWIKADRTIRSPRSMLRHTAGWTRQKCDRWGIPRRKVGAADLRAGRGGICGHADTSAAWGETDHTDPGTGFPWDVFIQMVEGQESDDMPTTGEIWGHGIEDPNQPGVNYPAYDWVRFGRIKAGEALDMGHQVKAEVLEVKAEVAELKNALESLQTGTGYSLADLVRAVNDDADKRDRDGNPATGQVS